MASSSTDTAQVAASTEAAATSATRSLRQLSLEHDPSTPDVISEDDTPIASTSTSPPPPPTTNDDTVLITGDDESARKPFERTDDGKITGAPTRLGGRILTEDRDPWTHNAW